MSWDLAEAVATAPVFSGSPEVLNDKGFVQIRPLESAEQALEARFLERLSFDARRYRFVGQMADSEGLSAQELSQFEFAPDTTFAAMVPDGRGGQIAGIARYSLDANGSKCECTVTLADSWHKPGLELLLMRRLLDLARARGIRSLYSIDEVVDTRMRELAERLGFQRRPHPRDPSLCIHRLAM